MMRVVVTMTVVDYGGNDYDNDGGDDYDDYDGGDYDEGGGAVPA